MGLVHGFSSVGGSLARAGCCRAGCLSVWWLRCIWCWVKVPTTILDWQGLENLETLYEKKSRPIIEHKRVSTSAWSLKNICCSLHSNSAASNFQPKRRRALHLTMADSGQGYRAHGTWTVIYRTDKDPRWTVRKEKGGDSPWGAVAYVYVLSLGLGGLGLDGLGLDLGLG